MPSRRSVLAALAATGTVGGMAGCSAVSPDWTGHLQLKAIALTWEYDGGTYRDEPLRVQFDRDDGVAFGGYDPNYVGSTVRAPDEVVVPDAVDSTLSAWFDVEYVVRLCDLTFDDGSEGCLTRETSLSDFNRVQMTDRAAVVERDDRFDVRGLSEDEYDVGDSRIHRFDFAELHEDHQPPDVEL